MQIYNKKNIYANLHRYFLKFYLLNTLSAYSQYSYIVSIEYLISPFSLLQARHKKIISAKYKKNETTSLKSFITIPYIDLLNL